MTEKSEHQTRIFHLLNSFTSLDSLKQLLWQELNYEQVNRPLSLRTAAPGVAEKLIGDPVLFAAGGDDHAFHIIYWSAQV